VPLLCYLGLHIKLKVEKMEKRPKVLTRGGDAPAANWVALKRLNDLKSVRFVTVLTCWD
jgi:hypothetical protein